MAKKDDFNIDEAMNRLDEINKILAEGKVSLKESLDLYKEGTELANKCNEHLIGVEQEIKVINESV